jgi:hypothetical protein
MNNRYRTRRSRQYPGGHSMNRRLDRISASAASTPLVAYGSTLRTFSHFSTSKESAHTLSHAR